MDRERLAAALENADMAVLVMVLVHLTGSRRWLSERYRPQRDGRLFAEESGGLPETVQRELRQAVLATLTEVEVEPAALPDALLGEMLSVCVGEPVPPEYLLPVMEDIGIRAASDPPELERSPSGFHVTVIGAGLSGICLGIHLRQMGIPFTILEKNPSVGGTWYENTYPEAGVDTPNHFYSYSFASQWKWSSYFSKQHELLAYFEHCVDEYGVRDQIVLNALVTDAHFDETNRRWETSYTVDGRLRRIFSSVLVTAVGQVNEPKLPEIEGIERFGGPLFHTARWPPGLDLAGQRVALVGTGASAVQAARSIAREAERLTIFQRSPQWIMPNPDYHRTVSPEKEFLLEHVPFYAAWYRFGLFWRYADGVHSALIVDPDWPHQDRSVNSTNDRHRGFLTRHMAAQLADRPDLLAKALPSYPPYGKRMVVDNDWFATLRRDNVELVAAGLSAITRSGVRAADGSERRADVIVMATGFHASRMLWPLELFGRGGVSIDEAWSQDEPRTNLGITTPGFPNLFMLLGPTTALAHGGSVIWQTEIQVRYIVQILARMINDELAVVECTEEAADDYTDRADAAHARLVFSHPGMNNWYKNRRGRVVTVSPWRLVDYWAMARDADFSEFRLEGAALPEVRPRG
jgi:4-hydroxyacetophenone monooxygenase